jgi:hypothetical protein
MNEETMEIMIASVNSLNKLFDRLNVPEEKRKELTSFFASEVGLAMGQMKMIEIQKKVELVIKTRPEK